MKLHVVVVQLLRHFQATQDADFFMQPYFDPTRKTTSKNWKTTLRRRKKRKLEDDLQRMKI
jgi:hypothetical protein